MEKYDATCGYVLGNSFNFPEFEQVFTIDHFFKRFFQGELPHYNLWIIGQGLSHAERQMLLKLQNVCPSLTFSSAAFDATQLEPQEQAIELQYFYPIASLHYQAELYILGELKPSVLMEGLDKLLRQGLVSEYPDHELFLRNSHLLQIRRLLPLALSIEVKLEKILHPNSQYFTFKGKARFYQESHCMAEINLLFELEKQEVSKKHANQAAEKVFTQEGVECC